MRTFRWRSVALGSVAAALHALPALGAPLMILHDGFEAYPDQASFEGSWSEDGTTTYHLDTGFGAGGGQSVKLEPVPSGDGSTNRWFRNLGGTYNGSDLAPLLFSYDLYLPAENAASGWANAANSCDVRGYTGGGYKQGALSDLVAVGAVAYPGFSKNRFQARVIAHAVPQVTTYGYLNLDAPMAPVRSAGWHHMEAVVTSSRIAFRIDGLSAGEVGTGLPLGVNCIVIGTGWAITGANVMWVDNVRVEIIPEPWTLLLLTFGGIALRWRPGARAEE